MPKLEYKVNDENNLTDLQNEVVKFGVDRFNSTVLEADYYRELVDRCYKLWFRWRKAPTRKTAHLSRLFIPIVFNIIETILPLLVLTIFGVRNFIEVNPTGEEDQDLARRVNNYLAHIIPRIPNWFLKFARWIKSCLMYGTGVIKMKYVDQSYDVPIYVNERVGGYVLHQEYAKDEDGKKKTRKEGYVGVDFDNVSLKLFRKDPYAQDTLQRHGCRFVMNTDQVTVQDVKGDIDPEGEFFYELRDTIEALTPRINLTKRIEARAVQNKPDTHTENDYNNVLERTDYWGTMPYRFLWCFDEEEVIDGKKYKDLDDKDKTRMIEGNILLMNMEVPARVKHNNEDLYNGLRPYIYIIDHIDLEDFYGEGEINPVASLQHEVNNNANQVLMAMRRLYNRRNFISRNKNVDLYALQHGPDGSYIMVDGNPNDVVKPEDMSFNTGAADYRDRYVRSAINDSLSFHPQIGSGQPTEKKTGIYLSFEQAILKRFKMKALLIEYMGVQEFAKWCMMLSAKYLTEDQDFRISNDDEIYKLTLEEIQGQYDFRAIGSATEPMSTLEAKQTNMTALMKVIPPEWLSDLNQESWIRDLSEAFGVKDAKDKFNNPIKDLLEFSVRAMNEGNSPEQVVVAMQQIMAQKLQPTQKSKRPQSTGENKTKLETISNQLKGRAEKL